MSILTQHIGNIMDKTFTDVETKKLKQIIGEGIQVLTEQEALKGGLKDTVDAVAEEMGIKPATLNKAIRVAFKAEFTKQQEAFDEVANILIVTGKDF